MMTMCIVGLLGKGMSGSETDRVGRSRAEEAPSGMYNPKGETFLTRQPDMYFCSHCGSLCRNTRLFILIVYKSFDCLLSERVRCCRGRVRRCRWRWLAPEGKASFIEAAVSNSEFSAINGITSSS